MRFKATRLRCFLRSSLPALFLTGVALAATATAGWALPWSSAGRTDYPVSGGPEWSTVADLNNDGHGDIVTANLFGDNVSVLLNNGTGTYLPKTDFAAGDGPFTVAAFDLNSDNFQDLVVANYFAGTISVLMGNGDGTFDPKVDHVSGANCAVAAIGWFNDDGLADIVTANYGAHTVSVFIGDGVGGFSSKTDFAVGTNPNWVAVGDMDSDGHADLVSANAGSNDISVLLGDGFGSFGSRTDYAVGSTPLTLAIDRYDGDNVPDVAVANWGSNTITVRLGVGSGVLGAATTLTTGTGPVTVDAGDLNLDGMTDLAVCNDGAASVSVLLGNGNGTFQPKFDLAVGISPYAVAIGDVTNDGEPDLVACNFGSNSISVLRGNVPGGFAVDDSLAGLTAPDRNGVPRSLSDHLGKWMVVDLTASWCPPCNYVADDARQVSDTWASAGLPFEYVMVMIDGNTPNRTATEADADRWADRYQLLDDVLHGNGLQAAAVRSYFNAVGTNAYPTLMIVDPTGKIRYKAPGGYDGQTLVNMVAGYAGVPAPPLSGEPPPPPPPPPPAPPRWSWQAMQGSSALVTYGASTWSGSLMLYSDPSGTASGQYQDISIPGLTNGVVQVDAQVDSTTGIEAVTLIIGSTSGTPMPVADQWSISITDIQWPDFAPRVAAPGSAPVVFALYGDPSQPEFMQTALPVQVLFQGAEIGTSKLSLGNVPDLPADTWAFFITGIQLQHLNAVGGVIGGRSDVLALAPPTPNPSRMATTLRWTMARPGNAELFVTDLSGRRVRALHAGDAAAGEHVARWDLRDDDGARVAPGLYFVRLESEGQPARSTRVVVLQ